MPELPDPALVARCAALARHHAEMLRARAARLAGRAGASEWAGPAARTFRAETDELVARLHAAARHLDDAAGRLDRHAATLRVEATAAARRRVDELDRLHAGIDRIGLHR